MRVHHLDCVSMCPYGGRLMDGRSRSILQRAHLVCHCLLVETDDGLVLVDTGFGLRDVADPRGRLSRTFLSLLAPDLREEMTAIRQIQRLGFSRRDVRHIVLTHLDFDHAGGLDDFPEATVHMLAAERTDAVAQLSALDRMRYRPQQWSSRPHWRAYAPGGDRWYGFERVRALEGMSDGIVMIPLRGHTLGHAGVAVQADDGWMFLTGDAYFHHDEMDMSHPSCPLGLRVYQWLMEKDRPARLANQARLRSLACTHGHEVTLFCSHDRTELERLAQRAANEPVARLSLEETEELEPTASIIDLRIAMGIHH
jgi:glyoxylase-like metal-dependent hydrolase (beta-lactamase superfamily II)